MSASDLLKYFNRRKPYGAVTLIVFGVLFFLGGLLSLSGDSAIGIPVCLFGAAMAGGGIYLVSHFNSKQSDFAIDEYCGSLANEYYADKLCTVQSREGHIADVFYSKRYNFDNLFSTRLSRRGNDGVWRTSILEMSCVFFTKESVYCYIKKVSLITDEKVEKQKEFRACDIQMVSLEEFDRSFAVVISVAGERISVNCKSREAASELRSRIEARRARNTK